IPVDALHLGGARERVVGKLARARDRAAVVGDEELDPHPVSDVACPVVPVARERAPAPGALVPAEPVGEPLQRRRHVRSPLAIAADVTRGGYPPAPWLRSRTSTTRSTAATCSSTCRGRTDACSTSAAVPARSDGSCSPAAPCRSQASRSSSPLP